MLIQWCCEVCLDVLLHLLFFLFFPFCSTLDTFILFLVRFRYSFYLLDFFCCFIFGGSYLKINTLHWSKHDTILGFNLYLFSFCYYYFHSFTFLSLHCTSCNIIKSYDLIRRLLCFYTAATTAAAAIASYLLFDMLAYVHHQYQSNNQHLRPDIFLYSIFNNNILCSLHIDAIVMVLWYFLGSCLWEKEQQNSKKNELQSESMRDKRHHLYLEKKEEKERMRDAPWCPWSNELNRICFYFRIQNTYKKKTTTEHHFERVLWFFSFQL